MKKYILSMATVMLFASHTFADQMYDYGIQKSFYVKTFVGMNKLNNYRVQGPTTKDNVRFKSNFTPFAGLGIGYYFTDKIRADLTLDCLINQQFKGSSGQDASSQVAIPGGIIGLTKNKLESYNIKSHIPTLLANAYVDVVDIWPVKVFAGAGAGIARLQPKYVQKEIYSVTSSDVNAVKANAAAVQAAIDSRFQVNQESGLISGYTEQVSKRVKAKYKFAYALMIGMSTDIKPGINVELVYSWKDCGKIAETRYNGSNISVGLRFDI